MNLHVLAAPLFRSSAYLLTSPDRGEAVLIDAPAEIWPRVEAVLTAEKCRLTELWITHGHWNHMVGGPVVVRATGATVRAHPFDLEFHESNDPMLFMNSYLEVGGMPIEGLRINAGVDHGDRLAVLGAVAEVRHVPGHHPGSVLFYFPPRPDVGWLSTGAAFVGDTLLNGSVGRSDLPGGDFAELERSIRSQIFSLPDATVIYPGEGEKTTVSAEKAANRLVAG